MDVKFKGIVISETDYLEHDKYIEILTLTHGKVSVFCKNIRKKSSIYQNKTRIFCFCEFTVFTKKEKAFFVHAELIESFFVLSSDVVSFSLASYFLQVCKKLCTEPDDRPAKTLITCLNAIVKGKSLKFVKAVFELRIMADSGFMPIIDHCYICETFESLEKPCFDLLNGSICCEKCLVLTENTVLVTYSVLKSVEHILYSEHSKLFGFSLLENSLNLLSNMSEKYLLTQTDTNFKTLEFYKMIGD